jgi:hypothetical protein
MPTKSDRRRGNSIIEFTLVGIPLMFLLVSVFEMSRGMWLYHTLAHAVKEGTRFAIVRGNNCNLAPNNCVVTVRDVSERIRRAAVGYVPRDLENVVLTSISGQDAVTGADIIARQVSCPTLEACLKPGSPGNTYWPANAPGGEDAAGADRLSRIDISATYRFQSALAMFWPGAGSGVNFGTFVLPASSREKIQY